MNDKFKIEVKVAYSSREVAINEFEKIVSMIKDRDYLRCAGGNGDAQYLVTGLRESPLNNDELRQVRELLVR